MLVGSGILAVIFAMDREENVLKTENNGTKLEDGELKDVHHYR